MSLFIKNLLQEYPNLETFNCQFTEFRRINAEFSKFLANQTVTSYLRLAEDYELLKNEYSVLCQQLRTNLCELDWDQHFETLKNQLIAAFLFSRLLEHLCSKNLLDEEFDAKHFVNRKRVFQFLLSKEPPIAKEKIETSWALKTRTLTGKGIWWRLVITRSRRLIELIALMGTGFPLYQDIASLLTLIAAPILTWLAWIFFIPRLLVNSRRIFNLGHDYWSSPAKKGHDFLVSPQPQKEFIKIKFKNEMTTMGFELANDAPWLGVNANNCFYCIGHLGHFAPTVTLIAYAYDVIVTGLKAFIELRRFYIMKDVYKSSDPDYFKHLKERMRYEFWKHGVSFLVAVSVTIGGCFALAIFANGGHEMALIGSIILVSTSLSRYVTNRLIPKKPQDDPENIVDITAKNNHGFFAYKKSIEMTPPAKSYQESMAGPLIFSNY